MFRFLRRGRSHLILAGKLKKTSPTKQDEFRLKMFPLNIILNSGEEQGWQNEYYAYYNYDPAIIRQFTDLFSKIIMPTQKYAMPVILLDKETPKEAVCQVFENVNTGGVSLTVFELVTAIFAMDDFPLRKDWEERKEKYFSGDLLNVVTATDFSDCSYAALFVSVGRNGKLQEKGLYWL